MSLTTMLAEARRGEVLRALAEDNDRRLSELLLRRWVTTRIDLVDRDQLRADLQWLAQANLVTITKLEPGDVWVAALTELGEAVARGRVHPGVAPADRV